MKVTLRELFGGVLIVALGLGWWVAEQRRAELKRKLEAAEKRAAEVETLWLTHLGPFHRPPIGPWKLMRQSSDSKPGKKVTPRAAESSAKHY